MDRMIENVIKKYPAGRKENLIPLLQEIQREAGHLSDESIHEVSRYMNIPLNKIYGVATFYDQFRFGKKGKYHLQLCNGTACHINHSGAFLAEIEKTLQVKPGHTTKDGKFSLELVNCLGACGNAPVVIINGMPHGNLPAGHLSKILSRLKETNL